MDWLDRENLEEEALKEVGEPLTFTPSCPQWKVRTFPSCCLLSFTEGFLLSSLVHRGSSSLRLPFKTIWKQDIVPRFASPYHLGVGVENIALLLSSTARSH